MSLETLLTMFSVAAVEVDLYGVCSFAQINHTGIPY